jgi:prepilin-type N-terminal cleavage/methylation domain-containing protein
MTLRTARHRPGSAPRRGFTLVEILVVIVIILILVALTAAGAFQVITGRRTGNTELSLKKGEEALLTQWRKVVDQASKEPIDPGYLNTQVDAGGNPTSWGILDMAGGDMQRARVIWIKLRLKWEFPQNVMEVLFPNGPGVGRNANNRFVPYLPQPVLDYLPKRTYYKALKEAAAGTATPNFPPDLMWVHDLGNQPNKLPQIFPAENSAMLLLALTQGRTGGEANAQDLGAGSLGDGYFIRPGSLPTPTGWTGNAPPFMKMQNLVDGWGNPIVFYRWPIANPEARGADPAVGGSLSEKFRDPVDPEGMLVRSDWNNYANYQARLGVYAFEMLFHSVHTTSLTGALTPNDPYRQDPNPLEYFQQSTPRAYYATPILASAGKNGISGILPVTENVGNPPQLSPVRRPSLAPAANVLPLEVLPNPMLPASGLSTPVLQANFQPFDTDNLYSKRLRLGARGD